MYRLSDDELIDELRKRFDENKLSLNDLRVVTRKLEAVNRKLKESEELKSNFLSNIRNEIVNPLSAIMGLADQVAQCKPGDEGLIDSARLIRLEAFNLDMQLRNIFAAAEIEAGESQPSISKVDIVTLVNHVVELFSYQASAKKLEVNLYCECPEPHDEKMLFKTDSEKFQLVLSNLLGNAVEFSREGGRVDIRLKKIENVLSMSVKDSCHGISDDQKEKIFDRFRQAEEGVCKSHKGHGLGLSVTKSTVETLGGKISFTSVSEEGCTFTVDIPEARTEDDVDVFSDEGNEFIFEGNEEVL